MHVAIQRIYGGLFDAYGGRYGTAAANIYTWIPFISNLPLDDEYKESLEKFNLKFTPWSHLYDAPAVWNIATMRASPREATVNAPNNYGFQSWLSRGSPGFIGEESSGTMKWC